MRCGGDDPVWNVFIDAALGALVCWCSTTNELRGLACVLQVKMAALGIVLGLTGSPEGLDRLKSLHSKLLPILLRLVTDQSARVQEQALGCLVNMVTEPAAVSSMLELNAVGRIMDYLREGSISTGCVQFLVWYVCV